MTRRSRTRRSDQPKIKKSRNERNPRSIDFREVAGKVVASIEITNAPPDWQELEIHFTDGTFLSFELGIRFRIKAEYLRFKEGKLQRLKNYGEIPAMDQDESAD